MSDAASSLHGLPELLRNGVLTWALLACGTAQLSKLLVELVAHRRWRPAVLLETGGMPSSHSALMSGAAAGVGWQLGFDDPLFALAATAAIVVMYDASGVRRAAGRIAQRVNALPADAWGPAPSSDSPSAPPLKENLGHSRLEVLVGGLIGPAVALSGLSLLGSPWQLAQRIGWVPIG
ncbi:divergent PAP2 family protein [Synechococcus sp. RSCCF101]|uniref:divergent PAP2 family protein n=1 Tax=Synechococcus sp. RSCCF101 TaxID=2511069 RepID=UPI001245249B|nr:divergent PAP2 family protein [Synechococcus sp. RSCCF101]QEY31037.1 divergent PAP2 family protein [Synechococcus sp. RSCCF101]